MYFSRKKKSQEMDKEKKAKEMDKARKYSIWAEEELTGPLPPDAIVWQREAWPKNHRIKGPKPFNLPSKEIIVEAEDSAWAWTEKCEKVALPPQLQAVKDEASQNKKCSFLLNRSKQVGHRKCLHDGNSASFSKA